MSVVHKCAAFSLGIQQKKSDDSLSLIGCVKTRLKPTVWLEFSVRSSRRRIAECSKRLSSKAAASEEARRTLRYVEPLSDARTPLADFFSILLGSLEFLEYLPALQQFHRLLQLDILLKRELSSHVSR